MLWYLFLWNTVFFHFTKVWKLKTDQITQTIHFSKKKKSDIFGHNWWAAWKKIHNRTVVSLDLSIQITFYKKITIFHICRQSINKFYAKHNTWCEGVDWHASLVWIHWTRAHVPSSKQSTCLPIHSQQSIKYLLAPACYARLNCKQIFSYFKLTRRCRMKR